MIRLCLWVIFVLAASAGAVSCQSASADDGERERQAIAELRAEVAALERTLTRLEQQIASARETPEPAETSKAPLPKSNSDTQSQCEGRTKDGARCKRSVAEGHTYCWQHSGQ